MRRQSIPRPVSPFLQVVVDGIPLSSCTVYRYICGIFLDDISTREKFAFVIYCYRLKAVFHNLCTVLYWRLCGLTNSPIVKYPVIWGWCAWSAECSPKQCLPNGKLLLLSLRKCHGVHWSLPSRNTTKVLKNCKTFSSRPRPRPNVQDQVQDFMIQDQNFHFCPRGASRPRPWSRSRNTSLVKILYIRALESWHIRQLSLPHDPKKKLKMKNRWSE